MTDRYDEIVRRASDNRFRRGREELAVHLARLLGAERAVEPLADADRAAAIAAEARAGHRAPEQRSRAIVRQEWPTDDRVAVVAFVHSISGHLGGRPVWLVVPGREPQVAAVTSDAVLDNPLGFAALAGFELVLFDRAVLAGLWVGRHGHHYGPDVTRYSWEAEVWGAEPWLSAATRALAEQGESDTTAG